MQAISSSLTLNVKILMQEKTDGSIVPCQESQTKKSEDE